MRSIFPAFLAALLAPAVVTLADTKVELLGRAADNGFRFYSPGTPWSGVRVGEYVYTTFTVTGAPIDITQPLDHQIQPLVQANAFNIVNGAFTTRIADVQLNIPVAQVTDPFLGPISSPAALLAHFYYQVDTLDLEGAFMPWEIGACCFPDGSCQTFNNAQCVRTAGGNAAGVWTSGTTCEAVVCAQPSGVCCGLDNSCSLTTAAACGGYWSMGGACVANVTCPQFPGSCCNSNGSCSQTNSDGCTGASQVWTGGAVCSPNPCPTLFIPGYVMDIYMSHLIPRPANTPVAWNTADFSAIHGTYPGSLFDNSRSWLISFVGTDHLPYEMFVDIQRIVFSDSSVTTGSCCPGDGHCFVGTQAICGAGTWTASGVCSPSPCPTSSGACCYANGSCDLVTPTACASAANSIYQGDGTSCSASTCGSTGACCAGGACTIVVQAACSASGGSWLGSGTTCAIVPQHASAFAILSGSCCIGNSCSVYASQYQCTSGTWRAETTCNNTVCGSNGACCNNTTGACIMATNGTTGCNGGTWSSGVPCTPTPCPSTGSCCNVSTLTCTVQNQVSCVSGSGGPYSWSDSLTCAAAGFCSGTNGDVGKCCSFEFGGCTLETQAGCAAHWGATSMSWTAGQVCDAACPLAITYLHGPSTTPTLYPLSITDSGTVSEVQVWVDLYGPRASDLFFELVAPNGAAVPLFNRIGASNCSGSFVGASSGLNGAYRFLDSAAQSIAGLVGASTNWAPAGDYQPAGCAGAAASLNSLAGQSIAGTWSLRVTDFRGDIRMYMRSWAISFNGGNPAPCTLGRCNLPGGGCIASTFAQCSGSWSIGSCTVVTCAGGASPGACCFLNACSVLCESQCPASAIGGRYAGNGTTCTAGLCNVACCTSAGSCSITTVANCPGTAGALGSTCSPNTCPQPAACCGVIGACTLVLPSVCTGTVGSGTCTPNTCPGQLPPPDNDVCAVVLAGGGGASADITLIGGEATINATLLGATSDGVSASCAPSANDVWYRFTPPVSTTYVFRTCGTSLQWDSVVSVWSDCATQVSGACADSGCAGGSLHAQGTFALNAATPYLVRVSAYSTATLNIDTFRLQVQGQGACCVQQSGCFTGLCLIAAPSSCSGVHQGLGTVCSPNPCPQELGQCCRPDYTCITTCATTCHNVIGGTFGLTGTTCSAANNPCPIGTCCRGATCIAGYPWANCAGNYTMFVETEGCNLNGSMTTPCCHADYNKIEGITVGDIFDFLNDWFAGSKFAVVGGDGDTGTLSVQNIFDFLNAWFAGGC